MLFNDLFTLGDRSMPGVPDHLTILRPAAILKQLTAVLGGETDSVILHHQTWCKVPAGGEGVPGTCGSNAFLYWAQRCSLLLLLLSFNKPLLLLFFTKSSLSCKTCC